MGLETQSAFRGGADAFPPSWRLGYPCRQTGCAFAGLKPQQCQTKRRLARPGFADDANRLPRAELHRHAINGFDMADGAFAASRA